MTVRVEWEARPIDSPYRIRWEGLTEEDYFRLAPENRICEFKGGVVTVHSPAVPRHQKVVGFCYRLVKDFAEDHDLGEVFTGPATLRLEPGLDREPDVFFVARAHLDRVTPRRIEGAADFIIEVVSEGSRDLDLAIKVEEYEAHGVPAYWAVDLDREVVVAHVLHGRRYRRKDHARGAVKVPSLHGFWVDPSWLFADPLPRFRDCRRLIEGE